MLSYGRFIDFFLQELHMEICVSSIKVHFTYSLD